MGKIVQGTPTTYLDFGQTVSGRRTSYDYYEGQPAYDLFMGARYVGDMIAYRNNQPDKVYQIEDLRDQNRKYAGLLACGPDKNLTFYEVGSSVMGVIDALEYLNRRYRRLTIPDMTFIGVDNSHWMNEVARYTHTNYRLRLFPDVRQASRVRCDLFFAKGVSLMYAFADERALCRTLRQSRLAIFDYTFARRGKIQNFVGTGIPVTFLNFAACQRRLRQKNKTLIVKPYRIKTYHTDPNKITYDCIYGDTDVVRKYWRQLRQTTGESPATYGDPHFVRHE